MFYYLTAAYPDAVSRPTAEGGPVLLQRLGWASFLAAHQERAMHHRTPLYIILEFDRPLRLPKTRSCPGVLHERGNLNELDVRTHTVESGHSLK